MSENSQCFRWVFTLHLDDEFQPWEETKRDIDTTLQLHCKKATYQLEKAPLTGRRHFQGRFSLKKKLRLSTLKSLWFTQRVHFEEERGTCEQSSEYCCKPETRIAGPWHHPPVFDPAADLITNLLPWQANLFEKLKGPPVKRSVVWMWSSAGRVGKTEFVDYVHYHLKDQVMVLDDASAKNMTYAIVEEPDRKVYIFDMPRTRPDSVHEKDIYNVLEKLKNGRLRSGMYGNASKHMPRPHVIVFANYKPRTELLTHDRWWIYELPPLPKELDVIDQPWDLLNALPPPSLCLQGPTLPPSQEVSVPPSLGFSLSSPSHSRSAFEG